MAIVEAKKSDPASADEVFNNIFVGNKAAAEDTQYLLRWGWPTKSVSSIK